MPEVLLRVLLGFVIFPIGAWIGMLIFGLVTGAVNGIAYLVARGTRNLFGIQGTWAFGASVAALGVLFGKTAFQFCFFIALFMYAFLYPTADNISQLFVAGMMLSLLAMWVTCSPKTVPA